MKRIRLGKVGLLALLLICAACLGVIMAFFVISPRATPSSLPEYKSSAEAPVVAQAFSDEQTVTVGFVRSPDIQLHAPLGGVVTATTCVPGTTTLTSGKSDFAIDGQPVVNLSTKVPLWRDLVLGAAGPDVMAFKEELSRMGRSLSSGPELTTSDVNSARKLVSDAGGQAPVDHVSVADFVWIPSSTVTASACSVSLGQRIESGAELAAAGSLPQLSISDVADGVVPGDRQLELNDVRVPLSTQLTVPAPTDIKLLIGTPAYRRATADAAPGAALSVPATLSLVHPISAVPLPSNSITAVSSHRGCIVSGSTTYAVRIVGSQFGSTLVVFDGPANPPGAVKLKGPQRCG